MLLAAVIMAITTVGLPWTLGCTDDRDYNCCQPGTP